MSKILALGIIVAATGLFSAGNLWAGTEGSVSGTVTDNQGIAVPSAKVQLLGQNGTVLKETTTDTTGNYNFFLVQFGDYQITTQVEGFAPADLTVHVSSGASADVPIQLAPPSVGKEITIKVEAKRHVLSSAPSSSATIGQEEIATRPQGSDISLPRLLETTMAGVVQGPFNQTFIRGNHANVQYQIDGVQLPDSVSGTFAEAFSTRNIDHMEFITGGLPAEFGERDAAVVNIVTKGGTETPTGNAEVNYGTYNTFNPQATYGGSTPSGALHYFLSASYNRTDRGIETPQPSGTTYGAQALQGTSDAVHDQSNGNSQFMKIDWLPNNADKFSLILYQNYNFYQIPNFPSSFSPQDPYFAAGATDIFGNNNGAAPVFNWTPAATDDTQSNQDAYGEFVWKHTFSERALLQIAPYWKYSKIKVGGDPVNDLASALNPTDFIPGSTPDSFSLNRHVNNFGVKADQSFRPDDRNLIKAGVQLQGSEASDSYGVSTITAPGTYNPAALPSTFTGGGLDRGNSEAVYIQDDFTINKQWTVNLGLRWTDVQYFFPDNQVGYSQWQPRIGVSYMPDERTKLHAYYGRLFMPAPLEDLHEVFYQSNLAQGNAQPATYDIKPEKDNFFEVGIARDVAGTHVMSFNVYYKLATDMLDDSQLLNTAIATPYNYSQGYAYGAEFSVHGKLTPELSDFFNYSYDIAKGENISGGSFAFSTPQPVNTFNYLDHVQVHTANYGLTYAKNNYYGTVEGLYGSGLRTGPNNSASLPEHFTYDVTLGYKFTGDSWWAKWKVQGDVLNVFDNLYPITIANGYNGSHYSAGRELYVRLTKDL
jgi:outer membrane cobalamin receptor